MLMDMTVFLAAADLNRKKRWINVRLLLSKKIDTLILVGSTYAEMVKMNLTQIIFGRQRNRFRYL